MATINGTLQFKRGNEANLPTLAAGEPAFTLDTHELWIGDGVTNHQIGGGGGGTVTSVDISVPAIFAVSGNPVTTSGTITITESKQAANTFYAGPTSGADAAPTFRAIVPNDLTTDVTISGVVIVSDLGNFTFAGSKDATVLLGGDVPNFGQIGDSHIESTYLDGDASVLSLRTLGTGSKQACAGNDSRLSDARTPVGTSLTSGQLWVGNGSNVAAAVSMSGDATIASSGAVTIANSAITYAKIQNVSATDRLLGRSTAGAGVVEEITCTPFARQILDDVDAAAVRTTIGVGTGTGTVTSVDVSATSTGLTVSGGPITSNGTITLGVSALQTLWIPAQDWRPRSSNGCAALATVSPGAGLLDIVSLDFDPTNYEYAQTVIRLPKGWNNGTITAQVYWSHGATATNFGVSWQIQAVGIPDNTGRPAFGTAQAMFDTGGTTNRLYISPVSADITIGFSVADGDMLGLQIYRAPDNGSDTLAVDARLEGVALFFTRSTLDDS